MAERQTSPPPPEDLELHAYCFERLRDAAKRYEKAHQANDVAAAFLSLLLGVQALEDAMGYAVVDLPGDRPGEPGALQSWAHWIIDLAAGNREHDPVAADEVVRRAVAVLLQVMAKWAPH